MEPDRRKVRRTASRSLWRVFAIASWGLALLLGILALLTVLSVQQPSRPPLLILVAGSSILLAVTGIGLWQMRKWSLLLFALIFAGNYVRRIVQEMHDGDVLGLITEKCHLCCG